MQSVPSTMQVPSNRQVPPTKAILDEAWVFLLCFPIPARSMLTVFSYDSSLGIDIGTFGARAWLVRNRDGEDFAVEIQEENVSPGGTHYAADFSAFVTLRAPRFLQVPAKYLFYALVHKSDDLLKHHPQARFIREHVLKDGNTRQLLKGSIRGILRKMQRQAQHLCKTKRMRIIRIGLTIPVQWTLEFETTYQDIVKSVFVDVDESNIFFLTESEARCPAASEEICR